MTEPLFDRIHPGEILAEEYLALLGTSRTNATASPRNSTP